MFKKILIANRGEIACRIIRTARMMGIKTVSVYSEADTNSLHVSMADEAVYIGSSPASKSYLDINSVINAITKTGAEAVHPGYGFLSENPKFVKEIEKEGIVFIGPDFEAVSKMGDKVESKKIAFASNINLIPGYIGVIDSKEQAISIAKDIGFPVIIKAAAGGGGKGMRIVSSAEEVETGYFSAKSEAENSFMDSRIFIEKFIEKPRHIEIQILADKHGNIVCLGERECSVQRQHQKVIEEAPSCFIDNEMRQEMYKQSISLAKSVGYYSAGTVEFIVDKDKKFYFLEMNTRLQVEHPVTEMVFGIDLVEEMIRIAAGEKLSISQEDISPNGWAMEARIYAEDPYTGFLPSSGRISRYIEPEINNNIRIDSGVYEGGQVSMFYDAMVAKLCTQGSNRQKALENMQNALGDYVISGISNNIRFLQSIFNNDRFISGDINTNFIEEEYGSGFSGLELDSKKLYVLVCVAVYIYIEEMKRDVTVNNQMKERKTNIGNFWIVSVANKNFSVYVRFRANGYDVLYERKVYSIRSSWSCGDTLFKGNLDGRKISVKTEILNNSLFLTYRGFIAEVFVRSSRVFELSKFMIAKKKEKNQKLVEAPISGVILTIEVKEGDIIKKGQDLFVLEAMKMQNLICAERDSKISKIYVKEGDNVVYQQPVIEYES